MYQVTNNILTKSFNQVTKRDVCLQLFFVASLEKEKHTV